MALSVLLAGRGSVPPLLLSAGLAFAVALVFRMLDQPLCGAWPWGTHFLWHTFNGLLVGLALVAAERVGPARKGWTSRWNPKRRSYVPRLG